ncbi:mucin-5AC-like [Arapaima gigas]
MTISPRLADVAVVTEDLLGSAGSTRGTAPPRFTTVPVASWSSEDGTSSTTDTTASSFAESAKVSEAPATLATTSDSVGMETSLNDANKTVASSASSETVSKTTSDQVTMKTITNVAYNPQTSSASLEEYISTIVATSLEMLTTPLNNSVASSGSDPTTLVTTSNRVNMESVSDFTHPTIGSPTSSEIDSTTFLSTSDQVTMENEMVTTPGQDQTVSSGIDSTSLVTTSTEVAVDAVSDTTHDPTTLPASSKQDTTNLLTASSQVTMETITAQTHYQTASSTSPENDQVITEMTTSPTYIPIASFTSPGNEHTTPLTNSPYFPTEIATETNNNSTASSISPGNASEIQLSTSDRVTTLPTHQPMGPTDIPHHSSTYPGNNFTTAAFTSTDVTTSATPPLNSTNYSIASALTTVVTNTTSAMTSSPSSLPGKDAATTDLRTTTSDSSTTFMSNTPIPASPSTTAAALNLTTSSQSHVSLLASEETSAGTSSPPASATTGVNTSGVPERVTTSNMGTEVTAATETSSALTESYGGATGTTWVTGAAGNSSSAVPGVTSATGWWTDSVTVTPQQNDTGSVQPGSTSTSSPSKTGVTANPGGFCTSNPCPFSSTCVELGTNFTCQCLPGLFYSGGRCEQARVFPGDLRITQLKFKPEMSNRASQVRKSGGDVCAAAVRMGERRKCPRHSCLSLPLREGSVVAAVNNVFTLASNATQQSTVTAILAAIQNCNGACGLLTMAQFKATDLCHQQPPPCDVKTTACMFTQTGTATCICKDGYIPSLYSSRTCAASLLAVVVVSCVLGPLLLILLFAFILYCWRGPPRKAKYNSSFSGEDFQATWQTREFTHIPRASTNWDSAQMEMVENRQLSSEPGKKWHGNGLMGAHEVSPEDMRTFKGKNPTRYSYLIQGHENPYFLEEDSRRTK